MRLISLCFSFLSLESSEISSCWSLFFCTWSSRSSVSFCVRRQRLSNSRRCFSMVTRASLSCPSSCATCSRLLPSSSFCLISSTVFLSSFCRTSRSSLSMRSRRRCSRWSSPSRCARSSSSELMRSVFSSTSASRSSRFCASACSCVSSVRSCAVCSSFCRASSSRCCVSSFTICSCPTLRPAPFSTSTERLLISSRSCVMVSRARTSFSCARSTIFQAFSMSFCSAASRAWSSWDSFRAVCTLAALFTISVFSSRHLRTSRFSWSCDFFSAR
mmetsp:Transcript_14500/g.43571  ORF Transcript_14500/g.43571 Transcript_14500/m.43571 type:complete len:273 (-) Transcript_14500:184-1002(-)